MTHQPKRRTLLAGAAAAAGAGMLPSFAFAAEPLKVGLIVPMSGPFASTGRQIEAAVKLYQQKHGDSVAGRRIEIVLKDDGGVAPDVTKRIAQELVARDKVRVLAGFGLTPLALAAAPMPVIRSSSSTSPVQISRMPALARPRSLNCFSTAAPSPEGTNTNNASGRASLTRARNGA